jgi:hypothetical protein
MDKILMESAREGRVKGGRRKRKGRREEGSSLSWLKNIFLTWK